LKEWLQDAATNPFSISCRTTVAITVIQTQVYATAGNPKTPEKEIMAAPGDPSPQVQQLALGGICAFDDNVKMLQQELDVEFTDAMIDKLKIETIKALNDTVAFVNSDNEPGEEGIVLGNPDDC
jgi:hypothetical protein